MEEIFEKTILQKKLRSGFGYKKDDVDKTIFDLCNAMSDLRQNHSFLLDQTKRYREKEQAIATALLSAQSTAREIIEAATAEAQAIKERADAILCDAEGKANTIVSEAENLAAALITEKDGEVARMEKQAQTIITEAEKLAAEIVSEADADAARKQKDAERSIAFASAYQDVLGQMDGNLSHLIGKHFIALLNELTSMVKAEAGQAVS